MRLLVLGLNLGATEVPLNTFLRVVEFLQLCLKPGQWSEPVTHCFVFISLFYGFVGMELMSKVIQL